MSIKAAMVVVLLWFVPVQGESTAVGEDTGGTVDLNPYASFRFVQSSQNFPGNSNGSLSDIYYMLSILDTAGGTGRLNQSQKDYLITLIRSFQNPDGGFGDWYRDRSKSRSTLMAVESLAILGSVPGNLSGVAAFLGRLQVSGLQYGNFGFRSSIKDTDADISSTSDALSAYIRMGIDVPNRNGTDLYVRDHQNYDGGFGYQTNRRSNIFWTSSVLHTHDALISLKDMRSRPDMYNESIAYINSMQEVTGGFLNEEGGDARISYTLRAIESLVAWNESIPRKNLIADYIWSNQAVDGGFFESSLNRTEDLRTTYFAIKALGILGESYDKDIVNRYAMAAVSMRMDGGFGNYPGLSSGTRFTFDAVSALNLIGRAPLDRDGVVRYVSQYRNPDGGYGSGGISNTEMTSRVVFILQYLREPITDRDSVVSYLQGSQNNDGGFGFSRGYLSRGSYTYRVLRALDVLGAEPLNKDGAVEFLHALRNLDGGYGNYLGEGDSDLTSTYRTVRGLGILGSAPRNVQEVRDFIAGSRNPDGGFKRSPDDSMAPGNLSDLLYTYDAVLASRYLGMPLEDPGPVIDFIGALRNPDLGFSDMVHFTSSVSSTFMALWAYLEINGSKWNGPPVLANGSAAPMGGEEGLTYFSVDVTDPQGQNPEYVHLVVDGRRFYMVPAEGDTFIAMIPLVKGMHAYHFESGDGLSDTVGAEGTFEVLGNGTRADLGISVSPAFGLSETVFTVTVDVEPVGPWRTDHVEVMIDSEWFDAVLVDGHYVLRTTMVPGQHSIMAKAEMNGSIVYSNRTDGPRVYQTNSTRPDWPTFLRIQELIEERYGKTIEYLEVTRHIADGRFYWEVRIGNTTVYIDDDGTSIADLDRPADPDGGRFPWEMSIALAVAFILLIAMIALVIVLRLRKNSDED